MKVNNSTITTKCKVKVCQLQQGTVCHCVEIFILVNSLGCVSEQGLQMLGLLKLIQLAAETEKSSQSFIIKSLVRLVVEYACPVQSPFLIKEKLHVAIENIQ